MMTSLLHIVRLLLVIMRGDAKGLCLNTVLFGSALNCGTRAGNTTWCQTLDPGIRLWESSLLHFCWLHSYQVYLNSFSLSATFGLFKNTTCVTWFRVASIGMAHHRLIPTAAQRGNWCPCHISHCDTLLYYRSYII